MIRSDSFAVRVRLEHPPRSDNRVTLSNVKDTFGLRQAKLQMRLGELEGRTIDAVLRSLARELGRTGVGRLQMDFAANDVSWHTQVGWQYHHFGGTRMSLDPKKGVVDTNCRVHGTRNLFVAGSSVFPTSGHANPTMNLIALTLRLADTLKTEIPA